MWCVILEDGHSNEVVAVRLPKYSLHKQPPLILVVMYHGTKERSFLFMVGTVAYGKEAVTGTIRIRLVVNVKIERWHMLSSL
jgi:hypothetical protein